MAQKTLWIFKSFDDVRSFGNEGYADERDVSYAYDNTVMNHNRVREGDLAIVVNKKHISGITSIERITVQHNMPKIQYSCPICKTKRLGIRKRTVPKFRCTNKHEFELPIVNTISVSQYKAVYSSDYQRNTEKIPVGILGEYYVNYNAYYSIQSADIAVLDQYFTKFLSSSVASFNGIIGIPYFPSVDDTRDYRLVKRAARPEQSKFRQQLSELYGMKCMISGCTIPEVIDASHISPYRGLEDNHLSNGILLRKDLHALFDADLIGIDPSSLIIHINPILENTAYKKLSDFKLRIDNNCILLSQPALSMRWDVFREVLAIQISNNSKGT